MGPRARVYTLQAHQDHKGRLRRALTKGNPDRVFEPYGTGGGSCIKYVGKLIDVVYPVANQDKAWTRFVTAGYSVTRHREPGARGGAAGGRLHPGGQVDRGAVLPAAAAVDSYSSRALHRVLFL